METKKLTRIEATEAVFQTHISEFKKVKKEYNKMSKDELVRLYSQRVRVNNVVTLPKSEIAEALTQQDMVNKYSKEIRSLVRGR